MIAIADALNNSDTVLKKTDIEYLDYARACPFLKWAGGKRTLVPNIVQNIPNSFNNYYEPFLGGGAVFFGLDTRIQNKVFLSDLNKELILTYKMLQKKPDSVIAILEQYQEKHSKQHYLKIRNGGHWEQDPVKLAARFIYLNKTCYNGLYRVNSKGIFNVPMGSYKNPKICDKDNLHKVSEVLNKVDLKGCSFEKIAPGKEDLVYCDPPYDDTFTQYTNKGFTSEDQISLRDKCDAWIKEGAYVIVSSSDTKFIRKIWKGYKIVEVEATRNINCKGSERKKITELLLIGY